MAMALGKYDGLSSSAQEESTCGLAVDMHHTIIYFIILFR
jgi:hypothetical protein